MGSNRFATGFPWMMGKGHVTKKRKISCFLFYVLIFALLFLPEITQTTDQSETKMSQKSVYEEMKATPEPDLDMSNKGGQKQSAATQGIFTNSLTILFVVYSGLLAFGSYWGDWQDKQDYLYGKTRGVLAEKSASELIKLTPKGKNDKGKSAGKLRRLKVKEDSHSRFHSTRGELSSPRLSMTSGKGRELLQNAEKFKINQEKESGGPSSGFFMSRQELLQRHQLGESKLESLRSSIWGQKSSRKPFWNTDLSEETQAVKPKELPGDRPRPGDAWKGSQDDPRHQKNQTICSMIIQAIKVLFLSSI